VTSSMSQFSSPITSLSALGITPTQVSPTRLSAVAISLAPGEVYSAARCPRECPVCGPSFETLLSFQLQRPPAGLVS
jgi:hypothetical protein